MPRALESGVVQLASALVTQEVVAGVDVVDPEAVGTRETLADVALEQRFVLDEVPPAAVAETAFVDRLPAGLTTTWWLHGLGTRPPCRGRDVGGTIA